MFIKFITQNAPTLDIITSRDAPEQVGPNQLLEINREKYTEL